MTWTLLVEALFNSLSFSSILILTALGLAITFGVMRVINMAHGDMLILGPYTAYVLEVGLIRFLYGRPLDTLLATWGVSLMIQQCVLLLFEADLKAMHLPDG